MPLLLLDRDGVINHDSDDYIRSIEDWHPIEGSIDAIAALSKAGYRIAIATNQSGLGRGYFTLDALEEIHAQLCQLVEQQGGSIAGIFYCPHLPDAGCRCRKPATGLLETIESELGESVADAWFVGDSLKDLQAARAMNCRPALVLTGKGKKTRDQLQSPSVDLTGSDDVPVFTNLAAAAAHILAA
jgi:D-glycero-D-manno-heptose 1,7-bisphosphate phosphatase